MDVEFLGATGTVTGSKFLVHSGAHRVLVDCGLFQGHKPLRLRNWAPPPLSPTALDAVILTHAHLDHCGYLPLLVKQGFRGPVYCSPATRELCRVLLLDSGRLQEEEAERANRHSYSKHHPALPLYTEADALAALKQLQPWTFGREQEAAPGLKAALYPAGHILGAAMLRLDDGRCSILFSGDLGRPQDPIMPAPVTPPTADYLVVESTYGNRDHGAVRPEDQLAVLISTVHARGGVIMIPAFAVGRTQALLWMVQRLKAQNRIPRSLPVYLNSPMGAEVTGIYRRHRSEHRLSAGETEALCASAHIVSTVEESRALNSRRGPMLIIAGSGMATGGRVIHHLKTFAPDPANAIVLAGFQAGGTRGAALAAGADSIKIHGQYVAVRAQVLALDNLSAHADRGEILDWMRRLPAPPRKVFVVHGEPEAAEGLRSEIGRRLGWHCVIPEYRERVELAPVPRPASAAGAAA